ALTGVVTVVIMVTKFTEGAWIVILLMACVVGILYSIKQRYRSITEQLEVDEDAGPTTASNVAILLVPRVHKGIMSALEYARALHTDIRALHITINPKSLLEMKEDWDENAPDIPLV